MIITPNIKVFKYTLYCNNFTWHLQINVNNTQTVYIFWYLFSGIFKASNTDYNTDVSIDFPLIGYLSIDYSHSALRYKWELSIWAFIK